MRRHERRFQDARLSRAAQDPVPDAQRIRQDYRHHRTGETNGDSHLKSLLVHHEVIVPVTKGKLDFGPWQQVYYAEFDGQRAKRVIIKVMGE